MAMLGKWLRISREPSSSSCQLTSVCRQMSFDGTDHVAPEVSSVSHVHEEAAAAAVSPPPPSETPLTTHYISSARAFRRQDKDHSRSSRGVAKSRHKEQQILKKVHEALRQRYKLATEAAVKETAPSVPIPPEQSLRLQTFQPCLHIVTETTRADGLISIQLDQMLTIYQGGDGIRLDVPRSVLVTGNLGYGKTTLCLKLLHDWAVQQSAYLSAYHFVIFVPLRDYKPPLHQYVHKELFEKKALSKDEIKFLWKWIRTNENKVLFILDGYSETNDDCADLFDVISGKLFPESQVVVTCHAKKCDGLMRYTQRRVRIAGFDWPQIQLTIRSYFAGKQTESGSKLLQLLADEEDRYFPLVSCPLLCFILCSVFESEGGMLPSTCSELYMMIMKLLIRQYSNGTISGDVSPRCKDILVDFGKLALRNLREHHWCYVDSDLNTHFNGANLGFLRKLWSFCRGAKKECYQPLHEHFNPFLAAYYISSVATYTNILRRELEALPEDTILKFLVGLLGKKAHFVFALFSPMDFSTRALFSLLRESGGWEANVSAVCVLISGITHIQVHSNLLELQGWSLVLQNTKCCVESVDMRLEPDQITLGPVNDFFLALSKNENVHSVRLGCLLGQELTSVHIWRFAEYVRRTLIKSRLRTIEVVISCLEDQHHESFQPIIDTFCQAFSRGYCPSLTKLVLDMDLEASQVCHLCAVLQMNPHVSVLHLPHLGCGREGLQCVAELILTKPLVSLNLSGSWQNEKDEAEISETDKFSPFQLLIKTSPSPKKSASSVLPYKAPFFSLPRGGINNMYSSLGRGSPVLKQDDKRHSDSILFQKAFLPLPLCDAENHSTGLHDIFEAVREKECKLQSLNVSKCLMTGEDFMCLGETVRKSLCLTALRLEGVSSIGDALPVIVALNENCSLQLVDLTSAHVLVADKPFQMACQSITKNTNLRLMCLEGWNFKLEEEASLEAFLALLQKMSIQDVNLTNSHVRVSTPDGKLSFIGKQPDDTVQYLLKTLSGIKCTSVAFLRLSGFELHVNDKFTLKGPELLPFLKGFTRLSYLNLSLDRRLGSMYHVNEKILVSFFQSLVQTLPNLKNLRICYWRLSLEDTERTFKLIGKGLQKSSISSLNINSLVAWDNGEKQAVEHIFIQTMLANMPQLSNLSITDVKLDSVQGEAIGRRIRDSFAGSALDLTVKGVPLEAVKALVYAVKEGNNKVEAVYVGGQQCVVKIKKAVKSANLMERFLRFASMKS